MKAFARFLCVLSLTAFCVACGGGGGNGTTFVSTPPATANYMVLGLDPLSGHFRAQANDTNDMGQIVGWSGDAGIQTAVIWTIDGAGVITVQDLGTLPGGTLSSIARGMNNLGQVVGAADGASGSRRPFIWTANDGMRDLGVPAGLVGGSAISINDAGQIVGRFSTSEVAIWTIDADGNVLDERNLGNLGGAEAIAFDNNVHGNVVGDIFFGGTQTGFFWSEAGGVVEIGTEEALGINDNDEVVGVRLSSGNDGYVWTAAGGLTEIAGGIASAINNSGQVTGRPNSRGPAFLWEDGEVKLLPMPENRDFGWGLSINEVGWIVGWSESDVDGNHFAYLWIPN